MATDTPHQPVDRELAALRDLLQNVAVAVYSPGHSRVYLCPNPWHGDDVQCARQASFTIPEAELLVARIRAGELGPVAPGYGAPLVLAYGIPWTSGNPA